MKNLAFHCPLSYQPYPQRDERLNYGIVVFLPQGGVRVHIAASLRKIKAFHPGADLNALRDAEKIIPRMVEGAKVDAALGVLNTMRILRNVNLQELGQFVYDDEADYMSCVKLLLNVECEPTSTGPMHRETKSRLYYDVRKSFRAIGILAEAHSELDCHRVIEGYAPDPDADVKLEFALQNGQLHLAQTVDLRGDAQSSVTSSHKNTAFSKAFALGFTKRALSDTKLKSYIIVAGGHTKEGERVVSALNREADFVYNWDSKSDMDVFFGDWANYAGRPLPAIPYE